MLTRTFTTGKVSRFEYEANPMIDAANKRLEKLADFGMICAWLLACAGMTIVAYVQFGQDFRGYYAAARVLLEGGNPYDYYQVAQVLLETTGQIGNNPFYYPLWFGWFVAPLATLPYPIARAVWMFFNLVLWILGLIRLRELMNFPPKGWRTWSMNLLATFVFAWMTWKFEQTGILLFLLVVETMHAYQRERWTLMGFLLAAASIKPNIMFIPVVILSLWLLRNKIYRPVIVMSAVLTGLVAVTTMLTPGWYEPILQPNFGRGLTEVLDGPEKTTGIRLNTTLRDWLGMFGIPETIRNVSLAVLALACLPVVVRALWSSKSFFRVTVVSLLVNFAVTPYALQYDFPPLTIALFWGTALAVHAGSLRITVPLIALIASVLIWERPISDGYWIVIGLIALIAWNLRACNRAELPESLLLSGKIQRDRTNEIT